ncbi:MAG: hypothetical protein HC850_03290 [Rhodomicrobium sp.]|nr:hypothetical protein [Rhodomicrobium sp.]
MSHIIECPECSTRYKMNQPVPEGGRLVKCAKCAHQWRLVPEGAAEQTLELDEPEHNDDAAQHRHAVNARGDYGREGEDDDAFTGPDRLKPQQPSWQTGRDPFAAGISTLSEPQSMGYGEGDGSEADNDEAEADSWARRQVAMDAEKKAAAAGERTRSSFFGSRFGLFGRSSKQEKLTEDAVTDASSEAEETEWTPPVTRGWPHTDRSAARSDEDSGADTENDIRAALKAALEQPGEAPGAQEREPAEAQHSSWPGAEAGEAHIRWDPYAGSGETPDKLSSPFREADTGGLRGETGYDRPARSFDGPGYDFGANEGEDEPFRLSGPNARAAIYSSDRDGDGSADEGLGDESRAFQSDIEDVFKSSSPLTRPRLKLPEDENDGDAASEFDRIYDDRFGADSRESGAGEDFERDAAALQAELESTDVTRYETARSRGGLAAAAAWAVFVSLISGVIVALTVFRNDIMTALPGTTGLYETIGFAVPDTGVDFADVSYRWTVSDGKPMIEVTGQVINITDRTVTVPRVLINVRDAESIDTVKATASVPADTLAPRESASFTLEFLSPPKNISQIELEFDRHR